jgi:hypothetical protein
MKSTHWSCDNYCGNEIVADNRPPGWTMINTGLNTGFNTVFVVCSAKCLMDFGYKMVHQIPMGEEVQVGGSVRTGG